jgi:uncharacterized membrane protein YqgA involved in biofilm formation
MAGVIINVITVIAGTLVGLAFGRMIPERFRQMAFFAIGSCTLGFGAIMAIGGFSALSASTIGSFAPIVLAVSLVAGSLAGEALRIEERLEGLGDGIRRRLPAAVAGSAKAGRFSEGFVTASIFFCAGAMTFMGSIQAGLGDPSTLYLKATLDGISSIVLSCALGIGVGFAAATVLVVQGGLALLAGLLGGLITSSMTASIDAVGGVMLIALGVEILDIKKLRVGNMLPSLVVAAAIAGIAG